MVNPSPQLVIRVTCAMLETPISEIRARRFSTGRNMRLAVYLAWLLTELCDLTRTQVGELLNRQHSAITTLLKKHRPDDHRLLMQIVDQVLTSGAEVRKATKDAA